MPALLAGLVGARLYHVLTDFDRFRGNWWEAFAVWEGGLGIPGGLLAGVLAGVWLATFLYEALWNLALAAALILYERRRPGQPAGRLFALYVAGYGAGRLWVESTFPTNVGSRVRPRPATMPLPTIMATATPMTVDDLRAGLANVARDHPLVIDELDVTTPAGAARATDAGILFPPGVVLDGEPFSYGRLSERKLRRHLTRQATAREA